MTDRSNITSEAAAQTYETVRPHFDVLLEQVGELTKKKPDLLFTAAKVKSVNRVLRELLSILKEEPDGRFLEELDDDQLPQASDALLAMAQFEVALDAFRARYDEDEDEDEEEDDDEAEDDDGNEDEDEEDEPLEEEEEGDDPWESDERECEEEEKAKFKRKLLQRCSKPNR